MTPLVCFLNKLLLLLFGLPLLPLGSSLSLGPASFFILIVAGLLITTDVSAPVVRLELAAGRGGLGIGVWIVTASASARVRYFQLASIFLSDTRCN